MCLYVCRFDSVRVMDCVDMCAGVITLDWRRGGGVLVYVLVGFPADGGVW